VGFERQRSGRQLIAAALAALLTAGLALPESGWARDDARYASVAILSPQEQATVHNDNDMLAINVAVEPALRARNGDNLMLLIDGAPVATQPGNRFVLANVVRGAHSVQAIVIGRDGQPLAASPPVTFYMWHASRLFSNRAP